MTRHQNISASRRGFLKNGVKLSVLSIVLIPFKNALASGTTVINKSIEKLNKVLPIDKLILNIKTGVVHLPTGKIFSKYPTIKRRTVIGSDTWEAQVKAPYHLVKEKSGIILEMLTLTRLSSGINDRSLTDAYRILSIAFTKTYKNKTGVLFNKYNFRLHHLLLQTIALNGTFTLAQKWSKFQLATANIDYNIPDKKPVPGFMSWIKSKAEFDKKVNYILQNKSLYTSRLAKRANQYKL
jgi:hypothetical protein